MTSRTVLATGLWLMAMGVAQAQLAVTDKAIIRKQGKLELEVHYPQTGHGDLDRIFSDYARKYVADPDLQETSQGANSGSMSYEILRNDARLFVVQFNTYSYYAGHAHGLPQMTSFSFLLPERAQVFLPELVDGQPGLDRVRDLVVADLTRQLGTGSEWTRPRAHADYFRNFAWLPDRLELTYPPYAVAAYAAGTRTVSIPLSQLSGVIRPDPRAPAPSFPCTAARSRIEKTICSDPVLARQDRQLVEHYTRKLYFASGRNDHRPGADDTYRKAMQTRYEATVASQKQWLLQRDKACAGGDKACLIRVYQERETALSQSP